MQINGRSVLTAIHKQPVLDEVCVDRMGLAGDEQADWSVHGGIDKAVYAYPCEHYPFWQDARRRAGVQADLTWGTLGENLSLTGLLEADVWVGDVLKFAKCTLRVTQPREPCYKFNAAMGFSGAAKRMAETGYCGFYLAVDAPGCIRAGETFELHAGPRQMALPEMFRAKMLKHLR